MLALGSKELVTYSRVLTGQRRTGPWEGLEKPWAHPYLPETWTWGRLPGLSILTQEGPHPWSFMSWVRELTKPMESTKSTV